MGRVSVLPFLFATAFTAAMLYPGCTDEPSGPAPVITSHEFVWEVDTIPAFLTAKAIYGTSASNVYVVGYSNSGKECWRWDGSKWSFVNLGRYALGDIADVDGVDSTYIVFVGWGPAHATIEDLSSITSLDNGNVKPLPKPLGTRYRTCLRVVTRDEIYLGGADGIQRFNGTSWEWMLDSTDAPLFEFQPSSIYKFTDGIIECVAPRSNQAHSGFDGINLYRYVQEQFIIVDSFSLNTSDKSTMHFGHAVTEGIDGVYSCGHGGTFKRSTVDWVKIHEETGGGAYGERNNLVIVAADNIWHFNGESMENLISEIRSIVPALRTIWVGDFIDGTIFLAGELRDVQRTPVIIRGRQQSN